MVKVSGFLQKILNSDSGGYSQLHEVSIIEVFPLGFSGKACTEFPFGKWVLNVNLSFQH